jgi:hypothetical protein
MTGTCARLVLEVGAFELGATLIECIGAADVGLVFLGGSSGKEMVGIAGAVAALERGRGSCSTGPIGCGSEFDRLISSLSSTSFGFQSF